MDIQSQKNQQRKVSTATKTRVKVAIRVRPMTAKQIANNQNSCVQCSGPDEIILAKQRCYKFDYVFQDHSQQSQVYDSCVKDLILGCFEGYNAAILVYGQTGSTYKLTTGGKTYTMGSSSTNISNTSTTKGIIPRVIQQIFTKIQQKKKSKNHQFVIKVSFIEIYNEQIFDLLADNSTKNNKNRDEVIGIREEKDGAVSLINVIEEQTKNVDEMLAFLMKGGYHRTTASTMMNDASSRSHAIFTINIEQHKTVTMEQMRDGNNDGGYVTAKFFFVDLAGSERIKKTGATGVALKQSVNINLGLLQLGNVISALSTIQKKSSQFIGYRNSKLTRILQQCLGGNSNTFMIACISQTESNFQQSLNTLKYASKAMNIKNKPIKNFDNSQVQLAYLKQRVLQLQLQNRKLKLLLNQKGLPIPEQLQLGRSLDIFQHEKHKLKKQHFALEKQHEAALHQLKQQKKFRNQLQIYQYQTKCERDVALVKIQLFKQKFPQQYNQIDQQFQLGNEKTNIIKQLSDKIQSLQNEIQDKNKINQQLQKQFQYIQQTVANDQKLLVQKNTFIYHLNKENQKLQKIVCGLKNSVETHNRSMYQLNKSNEDATNQQIEHSFEIRLTEPRSRGQIDDSFLDMEHDLQENQQGYCKSAGKMEKELQVMTKKIEEKERDLEMMNVRQMKLEYQLILEMKEQYQQKIIMLENEKKNLVKQKNSSINVSDENKFKSKIDNLQNQLAQYRKKVKQQKNLQKLITHQNHEIKDLTNQIKRFNIQKNQLSRKIRQDKNNYEKFKIKKMKQLFQMRKQNNKKTNQIKKLILQNNKYYQNYKKKQDELLKTKKINESLKYQIKTPSNKKTDTHKLNTKRKQLQQPNKSTVAATSHASSTSHSQHTPLPPKGLNHAQGNQHHRNVHTTTNANIPNETDCVEHVFKCIKKIMEEIDHEILVEKYQNKVKQVSKQMENLLTNQSENKLKLQKIIIKEDSKQNPLSEQQQTQKSQLQLNISDLQERITNAEENMAFSQKRYDQVLLQLNRDELFDVEKQIIQLKIYEQIQALRVLVRAMFTVIRNILFSNYKLNYVKEHLQLDVKSVKLENMQLKQKIHQMLIIHQQSLQRLRDEMIIKYYSDMEEQQRIQIAPFKKIEGDEQCEKKLMEFNKANRQISNQVQVLKYKCNVVQEKHQHLRQMLTMNKQMEQQNKKTRKDMIMELYEMTNQFKSMKLQKLAMGEEDITTATSIKQEKQLDKKQEGSELDISNSNKWQCLQKIDAHNGPIFSIATTSNMLISTSTKSLKIWDLQKTKMVSNLSGIYLNGNVKYVLVQPSKNIMFTACDKTVTIWDLITLNAECVLRGHKDQVRTMHLLNYLLFSGGKGLTNNGSLFVWDLRYLDPNKPQEEKQRNQDITAFTSRQNILYYGTKSNHIRRMNINNMEILAPFQPMHSDAVTGMDIIGDNMVSGSRDKCLRLWNLEHSVAKLKNTTKTFNCQITTVSCMEQLDWMYGTERNCPLVFAGSRDGEIKIGSVSAENIQFMEDIQAHHQSVNAIGFSQQKRCMISASSDKTIKIWKPFVKKLSV